MVDDTPFTPRLGRLRDQGAGSSKRFRSRVLKAAKRLGSKSAKPRFTGKRIGRGGAAGLQARQRAQRLPRIRMRRVIVKVYIARARSGIGVKAFSRHLDYIQRDGVDRDGAGGELYARDGEPVDGQRFVERSENDRHQFRIIVSPEDANEMADLKSSARALMAEMERDLGTRLDWVAVDHHNTGHPHTHIVIRGKDALGADLVIARDYLTKGLRARAEDLLTQGLGPRRDIEIVRARYAQVSQDRFTGLDHELSDLARNGQVELSAATGAAGRFRRSLHLQRLAHLESLHLATREGAGAWRLKPEWDRALKAMGRKGDIIRALSAGIEPGAPVARMRFFDERPKDALPLSGTIVSHGPEDELRNTRFLLVEDFDGTRWYVPAGDSEPGALPPRGAVVEVSRRSAEPLRADQVIAGIAERSGGVYSDALHAVVDPSASSAYRQAHTRRLEALRRAGLVERGPDGVWQIGERYAERAADFEAAKGGGVALRVQSWMALEAQIEARAETWLDHAPVGAVDGERLRQAQSARLAFLRREGLLADTEGTLGEPARQQLRTEEMQRAVKGEAARSGRAFSTLASGEKFDGKFERTVDLAQGRMAIVSGEQEFVLVPWRAELERHRGAALVIEQRAKGLSWTFPGDRHRGLSR